MDKQQIVSFINENMFGIWFLIGAALVFWMQAGFAMVETGFIYGQTGAAADGRQE